MLSGPFDDTYRFVAHIALANCVEYFQESKRHEEDGNQTFAAFVGRQRLLHNAAVSLNSIVDWISEDEPERCSKSETRRRIELECPAMVQIAEIANAAKHRVRRVRSGKKMTGVPHANQILKKTASIEYDGGRIVLQMGSDLHEADVTLAEAFRYWVSWLNAAP